MAFKLSTFCRDAGADLIADYARSVLDEPFSIDNLPMPRRDRTRFLTGFFDRVPEDKYDRANGDFRRVERLSDLAGQESLRQCLDPGDWNRKVGSYESARQRALFCWLYRQDAFLAAEFRKDHKQGRLNQFGAANFESVPGLDPHTLSLDVAGAAALNILLKSVLEGNIRKGADCGFNAYVVRSEASKKPENVFQLGISWTDGTLALLQRGPHATSSNMVDRCRFITVTYFPASGRIIITGNKLDDKGFEALASAFAAQILHTTHKPTRAPGDLIMPEVFLSNRPTKLPARLAGERLNLKRIALVLPTSRTPVPIPLVGNLTISQSLARHFGEGFSRITLPLSDVRSVRLEVFLTSSKVVGKARSFTVDVSPAGLKLSSTLDADLLFTEHLLELNGVLVRAKDVPLLVRAA